MRKVLLAILFIHFTSYLFSQPEEYLISPVGYYEGAVIRGNSVSLLTADIVAEGDSLVIETNVKEWTYYPPRKSTLSKNGSVVKFNSYFGQVTGVFDSLYGEIIGTISSASPSLDVHLKKVRKPPSLPVESIKDTLNLEDIKLPVEVLIPKGLNYPISAAIYVPGRGCRSANQSLNRAKILAQYGLATVVFDRRGYQSTGFDCNQTTIDMHASDLALVLDHVKTIPAIDSKKIGFVAGSYGAWVAQKASGLRTDQVAFIITTVGASTSVKQQQLDNAVYYTRERLGGDPRIIEQIQEYTLLEYDDKSNPQKVFSRMQDLLKEADKLGWRRILSKDDIPSSPEDLQNLWVRKNQYDPTLDLSNFKGPYLSVLAEKDRVVPPNENVSRLKSIFNKSQKTNYRIAVIPSAPHRMEHGNIVRDLGRIAQLRSNVYYFKFDRVVPGAMNEMITFLRDFGFIY